MRRRGVAAIVLLATVGQPLVVSAGEGGVERYVFYLVAQPTRSLDNICVGDVVRIDLKAERFIANKRATDTAMNTSPPVQMYGIVINAAVGSPDVGSLNATRQVTSAKGTPPGSTVFTFKAAKAGFTTIAFTGVPQQTNWFDQFVRADRNYLSAELELTVNDCEYSVTATSRWSGFNLRYTAIVSDVRMTSTGGGKFIGAGTWTFMITAGTGCPNTQVYEAPVAVTGTLLGDALSVVITYDRPAGTWFLHVAGNDCLIGASETLTQYPEELTFSIPARGGSLSMLQTLRDITGIGVYEVPGGQARVTVTPVVVQ